MKIKEFTIGRGEEDGCIFPDTRGVIAYAAQCLGSTWERGTFPPYTVIVDGETLEFKNRKTLGKALSSLIIGAKCVVFRNAAKCATINFDL